MAQTYYYYTDDDFRQPAPSGNLTDSPNRSADVDYYYVGAGDEGGAVVRGNNYVEPCLLGLICLVGLVGNGLVILVIVRQVRMRKVTYLYLSNLAAVNIVYLLTTVPFSAMAYTITHWPFGVTACKLHGYVTSVCLSASVFTLMITGLDRYLAVLHPVTSRRWRTERKAVVVIVVIWLVSFLIMTPRLFLYDVLEFFDTEPYALCSRLTASLTARRADSAAMLVTMYLLPQLVLCFCHLKIGLLLWQSRRPGAESHEVSLLALRERRRVAKIVFAVTVAFGIGWLPMHVTNMYEDFSDIGSSFMFENRAVLTLAFSFSANAINPVLYCLLSKHFRKHFKRAVLCCHRDTANAVQHVTPVLALQRQHEDIVVIDLENDIDDDRMDSDRHDDIGLNGDEDTGGSAFTAMKVADQQENSSGYHCYVHMANSYVQVTPSCHDSGHVSGDEHKGQKGQKGHKGQRGQKGQVPPKLTKATVVSTTHQSLSPTPHIV